MKTLPTQLTDLPGIGPAAAKALSENGFATIEAIAASNVSSLTKVPGFGAIRAAATITAAGGSGKVKAEKSKEGKAKKVKKDKSNKKSKAKDKKSKKSGKKSAKSKKKKKGKKGKKK